jgi:hypothetical protein
MLKRRWLFSALLGLVASMLLNLGVVVWNSNGTHNRFAKGSSLSDRWFFQASLLQQTRLYLRSY